MLKPRGWPSGWVTFRGIVRARDLWRPARGTVSSDSSWKAGAAGSGRVGSYCGRERGAELGGDRQPGGRPAARQGGWDRQEAKWLLFFFFFLMRALVTFEDRGPKSRGETGFFFPRWRILERRGAEAWGMRWPGRGDSNTGEQSRRRRRGRRISGNLGDFLPAPSRQVRRQLRLRITELY